MHLIIFLTPFLRGGFRITEGWRSDFRRLYRRSQQARLCRNLTGLALHLSLGSRLGTSLFGFQYWHYYTASLAEKQLPSFHRGAAGSIGWCKMEGVRPLG